ncbi:MAG TPA: hypothetical protein VIS06_03135 [Mycobacteriales bacterium]|jgi:hypothetical protein
MSDGYEVSAEDLATIAARLADAGSSLDAHASEAPDAPVAGGSSGLVAQTLATIFRSAGSLSTGLASAAEAVRQNETGYQRAGEQVAGTAAGLGEM